MMRIAVIGAGAIGGLVAGYLKLKGEEVLLVGHPDSVQAIKQKGLSISGVRGNFNLEIAAAEKLSAPAELVILATKTQDVAAALQNNREFIPGTSLLTTQNGVQADHIAARYLPKEKIISSIVMFGSTYLEPAKITHNFEGNWIMGKPFAKNDAAAEEICWFLKKIFPTVLSADILGMKYLKIFVNANNCLPAILGKSMQEVFADLEISRISIAIWREGLEIIQKAGIKLASLPDFPLERLTKLTNLPMEEAAKIFSQIMTGLSKEPLYGSILQSIKRGRASEIDYLNGEFVALARENAIPAPLNEQLVAMVHQVEKTNNFFTKDELILQTQDLIK
ncbi:MAG: ketopantoate reductase family protein [Candidatus Omnitrophica bacterium]|nr:ketopantoate reductase family protein [Candidatus Omnitrophota bacterium]